MTRGQLARKTQVHIETLRYYERRGLIAEPPRTAPGYRQYPQDAVGRIRFIKNAQELGFTLQEISELLALRVDRTRARIAVRKQVQEKIGQVEDKLQALEEMKKVLLNLVAACQERRPTGECPILETLKLEQGGRV